MAPGKDMRRPDLIVPYQEPPAAGDKTDVSATLSSALPMAAMFTRNKFVGWAAVVFSIQSWLGESDEAKKRAGAPGYLSVAPGYLSVVMSGAALLVTYMHLFLPPRPVPASGTDVPAPAPPQ